MLFRNLDSSNDWDFGAGFSSLASNIAATGLNIKTRLLSWVGDCFFDEAAGIDWLNRMGSKNQRQLLELDLRRVVLQSAEVTGIVSFTTTLDTAARAFRANFEVKTIYGTNIQDTISVEI